MSIAKYTLVGCALSLAACVGNVEDASLDDGELIVESDSALCGASAQIDIDVRRSLVVTEQNALLGFSFDRVMNQLVSQARVPGLTATTLFQRWWDSQNSAESSQFDDAPHCDDETDRAGATTLNGFPYDCREAPTGEGFQASCDPFGDDPACKYIPIGLFNRFDLAPEDGSSCGEYRIVYAKQSQGGRDRNLLIFEASMPNPQPRRGLAGCRPIVDFWAQLSLEADLRVRALKLETFYFEGLGNGIPAVVDIRHFGDNAQGKGQVRTNQFIQDGVEQPVWTLREFKLYKDCVRSRRGEQSCKLDFVPVTDKGNPWGGLFADADSRHSMAARFQRKFVNEIDSLSATSLLGISMDVEDRFNSAQSHASSKNIDTNYLKNFDVAGDFAGEIQERLDDVESELTPTDIVTRAQTQTCAGCHQLSNNKALGGELVWPASLGFVHVSEVEPVSGDDGEMRYRISEALTGTFLPQRKVVMEQFLRGRRTHRGHTMGGRFSH